MCYLNLKLRIFLKRKFQPKSVLKGVVSFIYSIDTYRVSVKFRRIPNNFQFILIFLPKRIKSQLILFQKLHLSAAKPVVVNYS